MEGNYRGVVMLAMRVLSRVNTRIQTAKISGCWDAGLDIKQNIRRAGGMWTRVMGPDYQEG